MKYPINIFLTTALLALSCYIFLYNLGAHSISLKSDEVIYTRVTQNIVQTGDLLPLKHGKANFFHKPPLKFWLGSIPPTFLGESNFSYRLFDALLGFSTVILTWLLCWLLTKDITTSSLSCFLMLSSLELTIGEHGFRRVVLDNLVIVLTLLSTIILFINLRTPKIKSYVLTGFLIGLIFLTKSVIAFIPMACACLSVLLLMEGGSLKRKFFLCLTIIFTSITTALAYYIPTIILYPNSLKTILGKEILQRFNSGFIGHNTGNPWFYLQYLILKSGSIASGFLILAIIYFLFFDRKNKSLLFTLIWGFLPIIIFNFSASKTPWYISLAVPFISIFCSIAILEVSKNFKKLPVILAIIFCLLSSYGLYQTYKKYKKISSIINSQTVRIPFDLFSEELKRTDIKIDIINQAIWDGTNPTNGKYNVEGIYKKMLGNQVIDITSVEEASNSVVLIKNTDKMPAGYSVTGRLQAFGQRKDDVLILKKNEKL